VIQHIVLFTPKAALSGDERLAFATSTLATLRRSDTICRFTVGRRIEVDAGYDRSPGDKSYDYAAVLEFNDRNGLIQYLNSPDHAELGRLFWLACESTVVVEVEVADHHDASAVDRLV
jgi:hypothetical protein